MLLVQLIPVAQVDQASQHQHQHHFHLRGTYVTHFHDGGRRSCGSLVLSLLCTQQVDSDHKSSKLLKAKPTATAIWPAFCSISCTPGPSVGRPIFWNGLKISTGNENSWRNASTRPGTLEDPPAR